MSRKVKSVSFNLNDPFEIELYQHAMKYPNFSSLVKRLIQNSISGKNDSPQPKIKQVQEAEITPIEQVSIQRDFLKQLI
jgi:hypothetical protein